MDTRQLIKGFQAQFWLSFASATLGALGAFALRLGRRGTHDEIRCQRDARKPHLEPGQQNPVDHNPAEFIETKTV